MKIETITTILSFFDDCIQSNKIKIRIYEKELEMVKRGSIKDKETRYKDKIKEREEIIKVLEERRKDFLSNVNNKELKED